MKSFLWGLLYTVLVLLLIGIAVVDFIVPSLAQPPI